MTALEVLIIAVIISFFVRRYLWIHSNSIDGSGE